MYNFKQQTKLRLTANWITALRWPFIVPMLYCYCNGSVKWGTLFFILSIAPDFLDGIMARYQKRKWNTPDLTEEDERNHTWWEIINYPGVTHTGQWGDPFTDKVSNILAWMAMSLLCLPFWMFVATLIMVWLDVELQFTVRPLKRRLTDGHPGANQFGKVKTHVQAWTIPVIASWYYYQLPYIEWFIIPLGVAIMLARLSIHYHLKPQGDTKQH